MSQGQRRLAAIMFTDMVGYTALGQRNESLSLALVDEQRKLIRPILNKHNGREVKTMGDAFLVEFPNAVDAVRCAYDIQRVVREFNLSLAAEERIRLRIGIHVGEVVGSKGDIVGDAVNLASRIEAIAEDGGVCLTQQAYDHVHNKVDFHLSSLGPKTLKNVTEPIEVYKIVMPWEKDIAGPSGQLNARRIAVLPFANMSPDPNDEYFADGMTEELISTMSKIEHLEVISRTSVMQFKRNPKPIREVSRELNAGTVLEGSVRKAGEKIRVTVQMIDAARDRHLWAESYDRELQDVFAIQSDIAKQVAEALKVRILPNEGAKLGKTPTADTGAYVMYLKGKYYWNERTKEGIEKAIQYFAEATKIDPTYAKAYAGLAECYMIQENWGYITPAEATPKRKMLATKALELDESLAESHMALAEILGSKEWNFEGAEREFRRAIELNPNLASAHHFLANGILSPLGRLDEAILELREAKRLDPLSPMVTANLGDNLLTAGRYEEAQEQYRSVLESGPSIVAYAHSRLGLLLLRQSRFEEGISEIQKSLEQRPIDGMADLIYAYSLAGRESDADRLLANLELKAKETYVPNVIMALANAGAGRKERALEFLQRAAEERSNQLWVNMNEPQFDGLRSDLRFQNLLAIIGAKETVPK
ncbi:MAG: tetratricopeptide repeat protein [Thaumarchaeota archaeon]|nr:tetratricopeptide repeat protein [Nitrososphaerota archaeon]